MRRPNFGVVVAVVTLLSVIAFVSKPALSLIPAGPENRLGSESADFLLQAAHHEIDWRVLGDDVFAEARKKDKPVMVVVGSACSPTGRAMDKYVFTSKEVRGYLARYFICARVDSMASPEWANAFLPLTRALPQGSVRLAIPAEFQIWFLDPSGSLLGFAAETMYGIPLDPRGFTAELRAEVDRFSDHNEAEADAARAQIQDLDFIERNAPQSPPDLSAFGTHLASLSSPNGGFPVNGYQRLWPSAWRFQLLSGRTQEFESSIAPCLRSHAVDLLDGGFFTDPFDSSWVYGGYDKVATTNASMLYTLSLSAVLTANEAHRWLALRTFDSLAGEFVHDGFIAAGRIGDEDTALRSNRSSFSPRDLREIFPDEGDRTWVRTSLGLSVDENPQMLPRMPDLSLPMSHSQRLSRVLSQLGAGRAAPKFAGLAQLDVGGFAVARMIQSARLLGANGLLAKAESLYSRLDAFRSFDDVTHCHAEGAMPHAYLGDYLAYSDAALQYFLATGNVDAFDNGVAVLRRALLLFAGPAPGEYTLSKRNDSALAPRNSTAPEIVDNLRESCTAQIIRLCSAYGKLLGGRGSDLLKAASNAVARFSQIGNALGQFAAGYFCAYLEYSNVDYVIVSGPNAPSVGNQLVRRFPTRLIAPAAGALRTPGAKPGVYIVSSGKSRGPLTLDMAVQQLGSAAPYPAR